MSNSNTPFPIPKLINSQMIFEESLIKIRRDLLQAKHEPPYTYYSLVTPPSSVAILAITSEGKFIINEEYRHPTGKILLGCPGGFIDSNEDPLQAAQRELLEETGYAAESFSILGSAFPYTGFSGQKTFFIRAKLAKLTSQPNLEASELIRPRLLMLNDLMQLIQKGAEVDAILCSALLFHQLHP